jgi:hypothetical protein
MGLQQLVQGIDLPGWVQFAILASIIFLVVGVCIALRSRNVKHTETAQGSEEAAAGVVAFVGSRSHSSNRGDDGNIVGMAKSDQVEKLGIPTPTHLLAPTIPPTTVSEPDPVMPPEALCASLVEARVLVPPTAECTSLVEARVLVPPPAMTEEQSGQTNDLVMEQKEQALEEHETADSSEQHNERVVTPLSIRPEFTADYIVAETNNFIAPGQKHNVRILEEAQRKLPVSGSLPLWLCAYLILKSYCAFPSASERLGKSSSFMAAEAGSLDA